MVLVQCGNSCFLSSWAFWKDLLAGKKQSVNADIKLCVDYFSNHLYFR